MSSSVLSVRVSDAERALLEAARKLASPPKFVFASSVAAFGGVLPDVLDDFTTPAPLNAAVFALSLACASTMVFIIPRRNVVVSEELIEQAEEESGIV